MQTQIKRYNLLLIEKKEIHEELYLPSIFSRVATDDYYEFSKKFDIGIDLLEGIKTDTGEMKGTLGDMKGTLNSIDNTLGTFVIEQREHNKRMDEHNQWLKEHNQRLEKILEKLAERF